METDRPKTSAKVGHRAVATARQTGIVVQDKAPSRRSCPFTPRRELEESLLSIHLGRSDSKLPELFAPRCWKIRKARDPDAARQTPLDRRFDDIRGQERQ